MNIPFEFSVTGSHTTPVVKKFFDNTDNAILAAIVAAGSAADVAGLYSIVIPTAGFWLESYGVTVGAACKVEFGVFNGTAFVPLYSTFSTEATGGGMVRNLNQSGPLFPSFTSGYAAMRVTGDADTAFKVSGDVGVIPR